MKSLIVIAAVLSMMALAGCGTSKAVVPPSTVLPAAQGETALSRDNNGNTEIRLKVRHFAPPQNLTPSKPAYVVWVETPENQRINLGQLRINKDREGELRGITPFKNFRILVTAEDSPTITQPGGQTVLFTEPLEAR